jgi:hypothetical protein
MAKIRSRRSWPVNFFVRPSKQDSFLPADRSEYRAVAGCGDAVDDLIDRRRGVVLSSGTKVPGRYESFDLGKRLAACKLWRRSANA